MALTYLLGTNVVSELESDTHYPHIEQMALRYQSQIALSSVSWHELWYDIAYECEIRLRLNPSEIIIVA